MVVGRLNEEYEREQDRQEKKRQDDVKAREAKSRRAYEVGVCLCSQADQCGQQLNPESPYSRDRMHSAQICVFLRPHLYGH